MAAITKTLQLVKAAVTASKPVIEKIVYYGKVELVPPKISDFPAIKGGVAKLINSAKSGRYREITVREAWLNTLITAEVLCWFYVGECIGKRHLVGYKV